MAEKLDDYYMVWGMDQTAYGPVDLGTLVAWAEEGRISAESWVYSGKAGAWQKARKLSGIRERFGQRGDTTRLRGPPQIDPKLLKGVKVLAGLSESQLALFARLVELEEAPQGARIITQGQSEETLYFILAGKLSVSLPILGKEMVLTRLQPGDFVGEMGLLGEGGRSADVYAETPCVLARLNSSGLDHISKADPASCTLFLRAVDQELSRRIRADNQRLAVMMKQAI